MIFNKGAMFGLDARIALAIFGALSVISGAALYSAIQTAKAEQYRQNFVEMVKSSEQYLLDNGSYLTAVGNNINIGNLTSNFDSLSTWNGPYIDGDGSASSIKNSTSRGLDADISINMHLMKNSTWTKAYDYCSSGDADCSEYFKLYFFNNDATHETFTQLENLFTSLDNLIDGGDGGYAGNVRVVSTGSGTRYYNLYYKGVPRKKS